MELFTKEALATMAGAMLAITILTAVAKKILDWQGRIVQVVALALAMVLSLVFMTTDYTLAGVLVGILNGAVIYVGSMGVDQAVNYGGK